MACPLGALVECWMDWGGIEEGLAPDDEVLAAGFTGADAFRPPVDPGAIAAWENRHGFRLPAGLRAWMLLSNGLYRGGPLIHPISAIGPMVIFGRMTDLWIQPESWFELGNPGVETVCVDLAYRWPGGGHPIFVSGDDAAGASPRIIARSFEEWFLELLRRGGREYWLEPGSPDLGDPWEAHRRFTPRPELPGRLHRFAAVVRSLVSAHVDEREIASRTGLDHEDLEAVIRHVQHVPPDFAPS